MKTLFLLFTVFFFLSEICCAQPGQRDSSFGRYGIVKSDLGSVFDYVSVVKQVIEATDGSLYSIREQESETFISKTNKTGDLDTTYGANGISRAVNLRDAHVLIQPDDKIVIAGLTAVNNRNDFEVVRFNNDGSLDNKFGVRGIQKTDFSTSAFATAITLQSDGKIVVAGYTTVVDEEGNSNSDFALARYNSNGAPDLNFSDDGMLITTGDANIDVPTAVDIQNDGKIVVVGTSTNDGPNNHSSYVKIIRYNKDGSIDSDFNVAEEKLGDLFLNPNALTIQDDGKIVITGQAITMEDGNQTATDIFVSRYNDDGSLDTTFNNSGLEISDFGSDKESAFAVIIQTNGKIVLGCNISNGSKTNFALARYNINGGPDSSFSNNGLLTIDFTNDQEQASLLSLHIDGKMVMGGTSGFYNLGIAHINNDGTLDTTFNGSGTLSVEAFQNNHGSTNFTCIATQSDGKVVVGGNTWNGNNTDFLVARYNVDGTADNTFNGKGWQTTDLSVYVDGVNAIAIQPDGKIVAGGQTSSQLGIIFALVRYNTDGTLDSTFSGNGIGNYNLKWLGQINSLALQSDGKIIATGSVWNGSNNDIFVARYNADGSFDSTFNSTGIAVTDLGNSDDNGKSVVIQSDGKIVVAGSTFNYSTTDFVIVRYKPNGILDATFNNNGILTANISGDDIASAVALQADGKIVVTGSTTNYDGSDNANTNMAVARYNSDGTPDSMFNTDGKVITDFGNNDNATSIGIERNQKILIAGGSDSRFAFARYTTDGILDTTFNQDGISIVSSKNTNAIESIVNGISIYNDNMYAAGNGKYPANFGVIVKYQLDKGIRKPIVSITAPINDTIYAAPATIYIHAKATDLDGSISKVEFYSGDSLLFTQSSAPYDFTWGNAAAGNYTITVKATDNNGNVTTSDEVKVSVIPYKAPAVSIINPANYETFSGPLTLHLRAAAIDPAGTITKVQFYNGDTLLRTENVYPYTYTWRNIPVGDYSITAKATNNRGLSTISAVVNFSVVANKAPSVLITSIADGQSIPAPATIPLTAFAKDPDGTINRVEFYEGAVLLSTQYVSPYTTAWKIVPAGTYTITAKAFDNFGLATVSDPVTITVADTNTTSNRPMVVNNKSFAKDRINLKAWPNPAGKKLIVYTQGLPQNKPSTIVILTGTGMIMKTIHVSSPNQSMQLDVSSFAPGMYTIKVMCADKVISKQFIKL